MVDVLFLIGAAGGFTLVALLVLTISDAGVRIWPLPIGFNLRSMAFWSLFRGLNVFAVVVALADFAALDGGPLAPRLIGGAVAFSCFAFFLYAGIVLGRENLYGGRSGLETRGMYRFSRNPQYAAAMPGYLGLAIGAWSAPAVILAGLLASAYMLMALAEEPWLEQTYGDAYDRYRSRVPRFYNVRGLWAALQQGQAVRQRA